MNLFGVIRALLFLGIIFVKFTDDIFAFDNALVSETTAVRGWPNSVRHYDSVYDGLFLASPISNLTGVWQPRIDSIGSGNYGCSQETDLNYILPESYQLSVGCIVLQPVTTVVEFGSPIRHPPYLGSIALDIVNLMPKGVYSMNFDQPSWPVRHLTMESIQRSQTKRLRPLVGVPSVASFFEVVDGRNFKIYWKNNQVWHYRLGRFSYQYESSNTGKTLLFDMPGFHDVWFNTLAFTCDPNNSFLSNLTISIVDNGFASSLDYAYESKYLFPWRLVKNSFISNIVYVPISTYSSCFRHGMYQFANSTFDRNLSRRPTSIDWSNRNGFDVPQYSPKSFVIERNLLFFESMIFSDSQRFWSVQLSEFWLADFLVVAIVEQANELDSVLVLPGSFVHENEIYRYQSGTYELSDLIKEGLGASIGKYRYEFRVDWP